MRILVGHITRMPELLLRRPLPGRAGAEDDILAFGAGYPRAWYAPGQTWQEMQTTGFPNWKPDIYIHWSPEYNAVPEGLEEADCLTVGVFGDWNLGGQALRNIGGMFDLLFADRNGCDLLRRAGFTNVHYAPLWAQDPMLHRLLPGTLRNIDILMLGNFNHEVQVERAHWLARVARLSQRYRVILQGGIYGEEYARMMNRAKIVFNCSIRGEINMRAYEAAACGALLFQESSNTEIRSLFADRVECVLYDETNLESLIDYYLAPQNRAERERIAEAGWRKVQDHTYAHHTAEILEQIAPFVEAKKRRELPPRPFAALSPGERQRRQTSQWFYSCDRRVLEKMLPVAHLRSDDNFHACLYGLNAWSDPDVARKQESNRRAIILARQAVESDPEHILARCNLGYLLLATGETEAGEAELQQVLEALTAPNIRAEQLRGVYYLRTFQTFDVEVERIWGHYTPESPEWTEALRKALLWRVRSTRAGSAFARGDFHMAAALAHQVALMRPQSGEARYDWARALRAQGCIKDAIDTYRQALEHAPFLIEAWEELAALYMDVERPEETFRLMEEGMILLAACPNYAAERDGFARLRDRARQAMHSTPGRRVQRLLAFPEWEHPAHWQAIVRTFVDHPPAEPALLMLRADPTQYPDATGPLCRLKEFLFDELGLRQSALPPITLLTEPLLAEDTWKLFQVADALVAPTGPPAAYRDLIANACLPVWKPEEIV